MSESTYLCKPRYSKTLNPLLIIAYNYKFVFSLSLSLINVCFCLSIHPSRERDEASAEDREDVEELKDFYFGSTPMPSLPGSEENILKVQT